MLAFPLLARRALLNAALLSACASMARADEPKCATCPVAAAAQECLAGSDVWLARLPLVGRLFKNVTVCEGPQCCAEELERIGIGFDWELCPPPPAFAHIFKLTGPGCPCENCACCPCAGKCNELTAHSAAHCAGAFVANCQEGVCGCDSCPVKAEARHIDHLISAAHPMRELTRLFEQIAALSADKAAAEAALEVREEAHEQFIEFFESMAELVAQNASLEAKLEAQAEHSQLAEKLVELASENARLKAQVELAAERNELLRGSLEVAVENERLKLRVAELEKHQATATAARPRGDRKPR